MTISYLHMMGDIRVAAPLAVILAILAWKAGYLTKAGAFAAALVGLPVFAAFNWPGYLVFLVFFLARDAITRHTARKSAKKSGEEPARLEAKTFAAVFWPGVLPLGAAGAFILSSEPATQFLALTFYLASLTTPFGDWASTEMGKAYGKKTYQLITFERVRRGSRGGVSLEGSIWGVAAILIFAIFAVVIFRAGGAGLRLPDLGPKEFVIVCCAALLSNFIESVIAGVFAQFEREPNKRLLCFLGSLVGSGLAVFFTNLPQA